MANNLINIYCYKIKESKYILQIEKDKLNTLNLDKIKEKFKEQLLINLNDYDLFYKNDINHSINENDINKFIKNGILFKLKENKNKNNISNHQINNNNSYNQNEKDKILNELQKYNEIKEKYENEKKSLEEEIEKMREKKDNLEQKIKELKKNILKNNTKNEILKNENEKWEKEVFTKVENAAKEQINLDKITNDIIEMHKSFNKLKVKVNQLDTNILEKTKIFDTLVQKIEEKELSRILDENVVENNFILTQYDDKIKKIDKEINRKKGEYFNLFSNFNEINKYYLDKKSELQEQSIKQENYEKQFAKTKINLQKEIENKMKQYLHSLEGNYLSKIKKKFFEKLELFQDSIKKRNDTFEKEKHFYEKTKFELIGLAKLNNYIHYGKICKECNNNPIKGILYQCYECKDYYLCEKCEAINFLYGNHPHNFIKIRKESSSYEIESNKMEIIKKKRKNNYQNDSELLEFENKDVIKLKEQLNKINLDKNKKYQFENVCNFKIKGKKIINNNNILILEKKKYKDKIIENEHFGIVANNEKKFHSLIYAQCINMNIISNNINKQNNPILKDKNENIDDNEDIKESRNIFDINSIDDNNMIINKENERKKKNDNLKQNLDNNEGKKSNYSGFFSGYSKKNVIENQNFNDYSYECGDIHIPKQFQKDEENKIIKLTIKNNGKNQWIENQTFLKLIDNQHVRGETIQLKSLNVNESQEISIPINGKQFLSNGKYILEMEFTVNNRKYGNSLQIDFDIE